jgi:hypothetical protein
MERVWAMLARLAITFVKSTWAAVPRQIDGEIAERESRTVSHCHDWSNTRLHLVDRNSGTKLPLGIEGARPKL